jgi:hypothetical protein
LSDAMNKFMKAAPGIGKIAGPSDSVFSIHRRQEAEALLGRLSKYSSR